MQSELMDIMDRVPPHALSVYLYMEQRAQLDTKVGMTQQEISRATRLSLGAVRDALGWLEHPIYKEATLKSIDEIAPLIIIKKSTKHYNIVLLPPYVSNEQRIRFTFDDTDDKRIAVLEKEVRRLSGRVNRSRFSVYFRGEKHALMREIEGDLGRAVSTEEAFLLGGMVASVGVQRVRTAWRTKASEMDKPIIGLAAMFRKKAFGHTKQELKETDEVEYKPIVRDEEPI